jgi:hypothetical protein
VVGGERFSDRPRCVCEVIAAFLRGWNDRSGYAERQHLRPYAERIVGSRGDRDVSRRRRDICLTWAGADLTGSELRCALQRLAMRVRVLALCGIRPALRLNDGAGELAARVVFARYDPETGFDVIDSLLAVGSELGSPAAHSNGWGTGTTGAGPAATNGSSDAHDQDLTRALIERAVRGSGNGVARSTNGADAEKERDREPIGSN